MKTEFTVKKDGRPMRPCIRTEGAGENPPLLYYPELEETGIVKHCFTTRAGGVSQGEFESMNLSFTRGDREEDVQENYRRIAESLQTTCDKIVCSDQTHTTNVRKVTARDAGCGVTKERTYHDIDGLITNETGLLLATFYADCVPLYLVDVKHHAIGLSHSGWKGTVNRMGKVTLERMRKEYGTDAGEVLCAIGPSICFDCYEVSRDVAEAFRREFGLQTDKMLAEKGGGKYLLDLWEANRTVLLEAGVKDKNIIKPNICTCCNHERLFSHRASHGRRGNLGAFMCLK